eukprot:CAMPEP_0170170966 /NCGR_PEP_ID=MMETSP0040_2-20121228/4008_1 /TAXON_ID=641309 /ORGANISM="Lotharella oceanica, Strain CCMP622" /LENGTH=334 /DNA_ID=CAMNT_0010410703 /DNA_START=108 /DNA_END=1112 /DNA_ORIENTATION=-
MGDEVSLRRIAQLANPRVAARIDFPRFGAKVADEDKKHGKDRVSLEREKAAAEQLAEYDNAGMHVLPKVLQMWEGERREEKLVEGLSVEDAYVMRVLLSVARVHESKQEHIDSLPPFIMTDAEDMTLNGTYLLSGFANLHPMYTNKHGSVLLFDSNHWQLKRNPDIERSVDSEEHTVTTKAKGFMPPLGTWDTDGKPILSLQVDQKSQRHPYDNLTTERLSLGRGGTRLVGGATRGGVSLEELRRLYAWPGEKTCVDDAVLTLKNMGFHVSKILQSINMVGVNVGDILEHLTEDDSSVDEEEIEDGGEDDGVQAALEADIGQMHSSLEHGEEPR